MKRRRMRIEIKNKSVIRGGSIHNDCFIQEYIIMIYNYKCMRGKLVNLINFI